MIVFVLVTVGWRSLWRDIGFWTALILSSSIQLLVMHAWVQRTGELNRNAGKSGTFLGFVLFVALYGCIRLLRTKWAAFEAAHNSLC